MTDEQPRPPQEIAHDILHCALAMRMDHRNESERLYFREFLTERLQKIGQHFAVYHPE